MKTRMKHVFGSLALACGLLSISNLASAQHATNYGVTGLPIPGVIEQQTAPTLVSGLEADFTVQTVQDGPDTDILVTSTDKNDGTVNWSLQYGLNGVDEVGYSMVRGLPGTLIIVGHRNEVGQQVDNYILCISEAGAVQWDRQFGNTGGYESSRLIIDAKGVYGLNAFVIAGVTHTNGLTNLVPTACAIDGATGNLLWHVRYGDGTFPATFDQYLPTSMLINENLEVVIAGQLHNPGHPTQLFTMGINTIDGDLLPGGLIYYDILGDLSEEQFPSIIRAENNQGYALSFHSIFPGGIERIGLLRLDNNRAETWTQIHWVTTTGGIAEVQRPITLTLAAGTYEMSLFLRDQVSGATGHPGVLKIQNTGLYLQGRRYNGYSCVGVQSSIRDLNGAYLGRVDQGDPAVFGLYRTNTTMNINACAENLVTANYSSFTAITIPHIMYADLDYEITELTPGIPSVVPLVFTQNVCIPPPPVPGGLTSTGQSAMENAFMEVYPNPSNGSFTMSLSKTTLNGNVQILDPLGRVVYDQGFTSGNVQVDLSREAKGLYTILLQDGQKVRSQKLLIE